MKLYKKLIALSLIAAAALAGCGSPEQRAAKTMVDTAHSADHASSAENSASSASSSTESMPDLDNDAEKEIWSLTASEKWDNAEPYERQAYIEALFDTLQNKKEISGMKYDSAKFTYRFSYADGTKGFFDLNVEGPQTGKETE